MTRSPFKISFWLLIVGLLVTTACNKNDVKVVSFEPNGEVNEFSTFMVEFNKDLAPAELENEWSDEAFIEFEPKIPGKFKWASPRTLMFSPETGLKPGQDYKAKISQKVLFDTRYKAKFDEQSFHTPYFDAIGIDFFWTQVPKSNYKVMVKANLRFNYEVDPKLVREHLYVEKEGKEIRNFKVISEKPAKVIAIDFGEQQQVEKRQQFKINVKSGLKSIVTAKPMSEDREFNEVLEPITRLAITSLTSGFDGTKGWIEVFTTQKVDEDVLSRYVKLSQKKKLKYITSENSFRIEAAFEPGSIVEVTLKKGLPGLYGGSLSSTYTEKVVMADLEPKLEFADSKGQYLMRSGLKNLQVSAVNVPEMEVEVYKVYENNVLHFIYANGGGYYYDEFTQGNGSPDDGGYYYDDYYYDDYYYDDYDSHRRNYSVSNYGKMIHKDTVRFGDFQNRIYDYALSVAPFIESRFKGTYVIKIMDSENRWRKDAKVISVSDIGLIAKRYKDGVMVFANSIRTTEPLAGVEVSLVSSNNQSLLVGTTNAEGIVKFEGASKAIEGYYPRMITAVKGQDFNYIDFSDTKVETSRFEVGGKHEYSHDYEAYMYADRNLFRPGEKAHLSAIVRDKTFGIVDDIPVQVKIYSPTGKVFREFNKKLNRQGSFEVEVDIPDYAQTGQYEAELFSGEKNLLASYFFQVEEFVPDKIRVNLDINKETVDPGAELEVDIASEYLFGAPAAEHNYEMDVRLTHRSFYSKKYKDYTFYRDNRDNSTLDGSYSEGQLDAEGKAKENFSLQEDITASGLVSGKAYVSVFDATGRTVNRSVGFTVIPRSYYIGIKSDRYYYSADKDISFGIVAVDGHDKPKKNFTVQVELVRYEWRTVLRKNSSGNFYYTSERKEVPVKKQDLKINGAPRTYSFRVKESGSYELRVRKKGSDYYNYQTFYAYSWGSSSASSFQVDKEGRVEMVLDKEKYQPGEKAKVLFTTPFSGKMLVTVERNSVLEHHYVNVENNSAELTLDIKEQYLPNVYISATLFKPHKMNSPTPFLVGHGYHPLMVEKKSNKLPLEINAPKRIKPNRTQEIVVKTVPEKDVHVTFALVDEGILQIKGYDTPDPYAFMYAKRRLRVHGFDMYELLLPEVGGSSPAGGDESGSKKRINPITAQRFKLLSYWSGIRRTNERGEVRLKVPIPEFNGEARLMAIAYSGPRFGSASKAMKISNDVVVMPALPRVLSIGDSASVPISLMNTTQKSGRVGVKIRTEGPLKVTSRTSRSASLGAKGTTTVHFGIKAAEDVGVGKIFIETDGLDRVKQEIEIAVRPASPLIVEDGSGKIEAGKTKTISIPSDFLAKTQSTSLTISKFPAVKFAGHLKYLKQYPHGCLEQTTSKLFPQLYFDELAAAVAPDEHYKGNAVYYVKEGIIKLQSMQMSDGSFAYWPGGGYSNWWGSVYATHFLVEAKKKGFNVNSSALSSALSYLHKEATRRQTYNYYTYNPTGTSYKLKARKEAIYSLYVLALAGKADISAMNYYRARPHLLTNDTRYLLAGAYGLSNKWTAFHELIPNAFIPEQPVRLSGGSFDSEVRANSIMLAVLADVDPNHKQIPYLVKHISKMGDQIWSTQDRAWAFLALGKAAGKNADANVQISVSANGKSIGKYNNKDLTLKSDAMNGKRITLKATGKGEVYYFWSTEGVKKRADENIKEVDLGIKVRRKFYNRFGQEISGNTFRQGDLVVARISILGGIRSVENIAISDLIPAGFEIENPRLTTSTNLDWTKTNLYPEYMDVRDDRLLLFTGLSKDANKDFYYMLRVVNAGTYVLPPIGAEAMYDPEFRSIHGYRTIRILPRGKPGA